MKTFIFEGYEYQEASKKARFWYSFDGQQKFEETIEFSEARADYDAATLDRVLNLAFVLIGVSYYKLFPGSAVVIQKGGLDEWQSQFLNKVYQEGFSQFAYENNLTRADLGHFTKTAETAAGATNYKGEGVLSLQSGGKDSIVTAKLLESLKKPFDSFYISSGDSYPKLLDHIGEKLHVARRRLDQEALSTGQKAGGLNGHVPVTYIVMSIALIQAVLLNKNVVLSSIGHEGEEPHGWIGDLPVNHQWSKTWQAELLFADYVKRYISAEITIGSPLRAYSELKIAEMFVDTAWQEYGQSFSSCNRANYGQGHSNSQLKWCGECPKCANFYLLFAPFLDAHQLKAIFNGQDLFESATLEKTFKGLLGVDGVIKPFECVGEVDELRLAYHMAQKRGGHRQLSFKVPASDFDYHLSYPSQKLT